MTAGRAFLAPAQPLHGLLVVLGDQNYLFHDLLPLLLRRELGCSEVDYNLTVFRSKDGELLSGREAFDHRDPVRSTVVLSPVRPGCAGSEPLAPDSDVNESGMPPRPSSSDMKVTVLKYASQAARDSFVRWRATAI
jgi:hypothetical protein